MLSVRAGSVFTFGAISADLKTAPGQVSARDLRSIYRIDQATPPLASMESPAIPSSIRSRPSS